MDSECKHEKMSLSSHFLHVNKAMKRFMWS